jgi:hypothetical protein
MSFDESINEGFVISVSKNISRARNLKKQNGFMNKKSQAAMEFLSTYGWSLIIIVIIIAALILFGVMSPGRFLPSNINFGPGIHVPDYTVTYFNDYGLNIGHFVILIKNGLGNNMMSTTFSIEECENNQGKASSPINIYEGRIEKIILTCENLPTVAEETRYFNAILSYNTTKYGESLSHTKKSRIKVTVNHMKEFPDTNLGRRVWALENGASGKNDVNRFFPCDDVPGCVNTDDGNLYKKIYGGYVDSMTGKVWLSNDAPNGADYTWGILNETSYLGPQWDTVQPSWNPITKNYDYISSDSLPYRDDSLGTAFEYCVNLVEYNRNDWKLPTLNDIESGVLDCNECLPPLGTYNTKFYWTDGLFIETLQQQQAYGQCAYITEDVTGTTKCSKDLKAYVRCVRDNP